MRPSCGACCRAGSRRRRGSSSWPRSATAARRSMRLDHARPDVVVLDVEMPELDGISTLPRLLRAPPRSRRHHGLRAHPRPRRGDLEGARARRCRLHPEARRRRRHDDLGLVPARTDREDPARSALRRKKAPAAAAVSARLRQSGIAAVWRHRRSGPSNGASRRPKPIRHAVPTPPVLGDAAAHSADRIVDRRAAGADAARCRGSTPSPKARRS